MFCLVAALFWLIITDEANRFVGFACTRGSPVAYAGWRKTCARGTTESAAAEHSSVAPMRTPIRVVVERAGCGAEVSGPDSQLFDLCGTRRTLRESLARSLSRIPVELIAS
eukprot:scaffold50734_cov33-Tisochrysis_lutea.AAC.1